MTAKDNGGPAFPFVQWRSPNGMVGIDATDGMSLRDWFAGQFLAGNKWIGSLEEHIADAYRAADLALAERSKP